MEPKFQTSFIPKKQAFPTIGSVGGASMQRPKIHVTSLFMTLAVIVFIASAGALVGAYFWKSYNISAGLKYKADLATMEQQFDMNTIENLKQVNVQIDSAKSLLKNHIAMSRIFAILQKMTIEKVRFLSMDFKGSEANSNNMSISMNGYGTNLAAVAYQSDVLGKLSEIGLSKIVKNPIMSDPTLDGNGSVSFGFSADIDSSSMSYEQSVTGETNTGTNAEASTSDTSITQ
jgi:hypothetical protein